MLAEVDPHVVSVINGFQKGTKGRLLLLLLSGQTLCKRVPEGRWESH